MISIGELIWVSFRPLIRLVICAMCGFIITKADLFPPVAARGAGQVVLNVALPCLMFSKIVSAFTSDNVSALGPLVLVAVIYEVIGIIIAWIVKKVFWVPHRFRYGILVAGGWGNVGDIPTSVIMSITGSAPFNGVADQDLAVAYLSVFLLVYLVTLFPMGGHRWIALDFIGPDVETEEIRKLITLKRRVVFHHYPRVLWKMARQRGVTSSEDHTKDIEKQQVRESNTNNLQNDLILNNQAEFSAVVPIEPPLSSPVQSTAGRSLDSAIPISPPTTSSPETVTEVPRNPSIRQSLTILVPKVSQTSDNDSSSPTTCHLHRILVPSKIRAFLKSLFTPISSAIFISFPIASIPKLKALFVDVPGVNLPAAPDGEPPLAFIMDTTSFIGAASVPLGLMCLGSALARLRVPRNQWSSLPLGAISWFAIGRMIIMPVLGVLICEKILVPVGIIPEDNKVIRFVCIFFSCLPTATTQVFLTQVYSGTGTADHLSAFLIPQYILMFFSMTILTAYAISLIF